MDQIRVDGWANLLTGKGTSADKRSATAFTPGTSANLSYEELLNLYTFNGFFARVIDLLPSEMVRAWFCVDGDIERHAVGTLESIKARPQIRQSLIWARLFGGSICLMGVNDGGQLDQPVNVGNIRAVMFLKPYDRHRVNYSSADLYQDPMHPKYGLPEFYNVSPIAMSPFKVHESRVLRFDGTPVPDEVRARNCGWGGSIIDRVYEQLRAMGGVYDNVELITEDFIQSTLTINNLGDMIAGGQEALVKERLNLMDLSRHVLNTILLDKDEAYTKIASSVSGLPEVVDRFVKAVAFVTGIPVTVLMGESPAGLNATGNTEMRMFYDSVKTAQEDILAPELERLIKYIFLSKDENPYKGVEPADWKIELEPLWEPTEKEEVEARKIQADIDVAYINAGVLSPEEVAISRFGSGAYSDDTTLQTERLIGAQPDESQSNETDTTQGAGAIGQNGGAAKAEQAPANDTPQ